MSLKAELAQLWRYRDFVAGSVSREFQSRYRNSLLGIAWIVINPLAMIAVYTLVFSQVMRSKLPGVDSVFAYSIFLMAGLIPWGLFSELVMRSSVLFIDNANLIKKAQFPLSSLVAINITNCLINFLTVLGVFLLIMLLLGSIPGWALLGLIPLVFIQLTIANGIGLALGVCNIFFRDTAQVTSIALQFGFWLTPIVYQLNIIPEPYRNFVGLNPLVPIFESYQKILVNNQWPEWSSLQIVALMAIAINVAAVVLYKLKHSQILDEI